jgi:hypothetical protein
MPTRPSEFELLGDDLRSLRALLQAHPAPLGSLADTTDLPLQSFRMVLADLGWQGFYHALAGAKLLEEDLEPSLHAIERVLFEVAVGIGYLVMHSDRNHEAEIFLAYTHLRDQQESPNQPELIADRAAVLSRMPPEAVATARLRLSKRPKSWSGKHIKQMAEEGHVSGYDTLYRFLCGPTHAGIAGRYVKVFEGPNGTRVIQTGTDISHEAAEVHANFIRRTLQSILRILSSFIPGFVIQPPSWDPDSWQPLD